MGHTIINSPRAVQNCYRYRTVHLLSQTRVPVPKTLVMQTSEKLNGQFDNMEEGVWVKRGDVHKTQEDDVQLIFDRSSLEKVFAERPDFRYASDIAPDNGAVLKDAWPERCFFTPKKMGAQTAEANINAGVAAARQIVAFLEEGDRTFQVNK
jgi:hypothetical protein